jgi:DNA-binding SARP family transcriptional activator
MPTLTVTRAWAFLHLGDLDRGKQELDIALASEGPARVATLIECADLESLYGSLDRSWTLVRQTATAEPADDPVRRRLILSELLSRTGQFEAAAHELAQIDPEEPRPLGAFSGRWHLQAARIAVRQGKSPDPEVDQAISIFKQQKAGFWTRIAEIVRAAASSEPGELNELIHRIVDVEPVYATTCADDLAPRLADLDDTVLRVIRSEAVRRPDRWRDVMRRTTRAQDPTARDIAARMLDEIGEVDDIALLRALARESRSPALASLGRGLARRLAPKALVHDLGHMQVTIGDRIVEGSSVRRKVLSLIAFLMTRPGFAATRDQVLDALWPELEPSIAANSLNQTVYFLRRVFEVGYKEDESAQYLQHDGEVIRLDPYLVDSQSMVCSRLIDEARVDLPPGPVERLSKAYGGRFALDFEYDDWASPFRENLHAGYLDVIEQAVRADTVRGLFDRASVVARRALAVDSDAEGLELALLRIYQGSGSHAAAAEQSSHYAGLTDDESDT